MKARSNGSTRRAFGLSTLAVGAGALPAVAEDDIMPRGAPRGRIGGATRGPHGAMEGLALDLVAPATREAVLVAGPQPTLFFLATAMTGLPVRFALAERNLAAPLALLALPPLTRPGLHAVALGTLGVWLPPERTLLWSVTLVVDEAMPSADIAAVALLRHEPPAPALAAQLAGSTGGARRVVLEEAGYWYDAFAAADEAARHAMLGAAGLTLPV